MLTKTSDNLNIPMTIIIVNERKYPLIAHITFGMFYLFNNIIDNIKTRYVSQKQVILYNSQLLIKMLIVFFDLIVDFANEH